MASRISEELYSPELAATRLRAMKARVLELEREAESLRDEAERRGRAEVFRLHDEKLRSLGRLAAGLAHEINTPLQFVGDNLTFLAESCATLVRLVDGQRALLDEAASGAVAPVEAARRAGVLAEQADWRWLADNLPQSLDECGDGLRRVREIVHTLKEFAMPADRERIECDVNEALVRALVVARHEYKAHAEVRTELGDVPRARCSLDDLHQVLFNLIVNAAQAIADRHAGRGLIRVSTRLDGDEVVIEVADDGCGIPRAIRPRIFEQFVTTRPVGAGAGQGLALAWALIVQKHGGALTFQTEEGRGTTFEVRLPVYAAAPA